MHNATNDVSAHKTLVFSDTNPFYFLPFARFVLKGFAKDGRDLTDKETKAFLKAADKDGDGKIGVDGEHQILLGECHKVTQTDKAYIE